MKPLRLILVLLTNPQELLDRVHAILTSRWEAKQTRKVRYDAKGFDAAVRVISDCGESDLTRFLREGCLLEVEKSVCKRKQGLKEGPFGSFHDGDSALARLCYAAVRALQPELVVETGVCYGVTSAHLLKALEANGRGQLHSIDLPPLGKDGDDYVGWLVPEESRGRWTLHRGTSGRLLRPLLSKLGQIDLFIHDSLHTYRNMREEFALAWPALRPGGVLISDDIEGNPAFLDLSRLPEMAVSAVIQEEGKEALLGVAVKKR